MAGQAGDGRGGLAAWWHSAARRPAVLWTLALVNAVVGLEAAAALAYSALRDTGSQNVSRSSERSVPVPVRAAPIAAPAPVGPQPAPLAVRIPSIGASSDLLALDVDATGMLEAPRDFAKAGWWTAGPAPGDHGAAVIVGHLDSHQGPAVFFEVPKMMPGDEIEVSRSDGSTAVFVVDAVDQFNKESLPARRIYGPTPGPELRLITCGGEFDRRTKSYLDNVVVFAHQARVVPAGGGA